MGILRSVREEEREQLAALYNNSFRTGGETGQNWAAATDLANTLAIFEKGALESCISIKPYRVWYGGREMDMGGIAGVCTWADRQGRGHAGTIMKASLPAMRERGQFISFLYPFSVRYYRKFGWETVAERIVYSDLHLTDFFSHEEFQKVRVLRGDVEDLGCLDAAYRASATSYNGMLIRSPEDWKRKITQTMEKNGQVYLVEEEGRPTGYFLCENQRSASGGHESITREFGCSTPVALKAMLGFHATFPFIVKKISIVAPAEPTLTNEFKEPPAMQYGAPYQGRVVDVERAMAERGFDGHVRGGVVVGVHDASASWNQGAWLLEFENGRGRATQSSAEPHVSLTIQQFSQAFLGAVDPVREARLGRFPSASREAMALLREAFFDRPLHMNEAF